MIRRNNDETSTWISTTDLISGTLVIFLFMAVMLMQDSQKKSEKIGNYIQKSQEAKLWLRSGFEEQFNPYEIKKYSINLTMDDDLGKASFPDNIGTFDQGQSVLKPQFKQELDVFLPKYFAAIAKCDPKRIKEIRIEGHTSSEWGKGGNFSEDEAYILNMELSQSRTRAILQYAMTMPSLIKYHDLMKAKLTANGLSSSHLIMENGVENKEKSRRIEFRVVSDDTIVLDQIKDVISPNK